MGHHDDYYDERARTDWLFEQIDLTNDIKKGMYDPNDNSKLTPQASLMLVDTRVMRKILSLVKEYVDPAVIKSKI